jgi:hypothetical protein
MSTAWDVYCLDCKSDADFYDADRQHALMQALAKLGPQIKKICEAMAPLEALDKPPSSIYCNPRVVLNADSPSRLWPLDTSWWIQHGDHRLVARDEYGRCDDECGEWYQCSECKTSKCCRRMKGHANGHGEMREEKR